jgi:hypothetical protein
MIPPGRPKGESLSAPRDGHRVNVRSRSEALFPQHAAQRVIE